MLSEKQIKIFPKISTISHILPPKVAEFMRDNPHIHFGTKDKILSHPINYDVDVRFELMEQYPDVVEVLGLPFGHTMEEITDSPKLELELAQRVNDEMAELVAKHDRFVGAFATLPLSNIDAACKELERAITQLKLRGMQMGTPVNGKAPDSPEFMPLYEMMEKCDLPIFFHPSSGPNVADYAGETESKYDIWVLWRWPYDTTVMLTRLIMSGVLERYPNLKIITHHVGAMVPFFWRRIEHFYDTCEMQYGYEYFKNISKPPIEYFRKIYNDTCVDGNTAALMCAYEFFGPEHLLFSIDLPYRWHFKAVVTSIEEMDIPEYEKRLIFGENARGLMRLGLI